MATKKVGPPQKKRKEASSSQAALGYDPTKFLDAEKEDRYKQLLKWNFIPERKVELKEDEFPEFQEIIRQRGWGAVANPDTKFDPDVVKEFYANAYPSSQGGGTFEYRSWVRGKWINYNKAAINDLLGSPFAERHVCTYHRLKSKSHTLTGGFIPAMAVDSICIQGRTFEENPDGSPMRILRKDMTTMAQIWMTLMLHNIAPNSHVASLPLESCYLLHSILTIEHFRVDVAWVITEFIYKTTTKSGAKGTLGFPSLITTLCERQGVVVQRSQQIKPPITKNYIQNYCREDQAPSRPQPQQAPPQQPSTIDQQLARISLHLEHIELQNDMLRQGQLHQQQAFYETAETYLPGQQIWLHPTQFATTYPWPGVRPTFPGEGGVAAEPAPEAASGDAPGVAGVDQDAEEGDTEEEEGTKELEDGSEEEES